MDAITLTKLQRPRVGHRLVPRPRLLERLDAAQSLTLVVAPAGGGKTTLLSTWLETCNLPNAWLSLDERDNDLGLFTTYLIAALETLFPAVGNARSMVSGAILPSTDMIARTLLNDLAVVEQDFVLVLDDYQVIRDQAIHDLIAEILLYPPSPMHLVIAGRQDPPLPLAALRVRGDVTELRRTDLWFTQEEARQFLVECSGLKLDEQATAELTASIGGWPVGLRLAAMLLSRQPAVMHTGSALGQNRYVMDYMAAEVLSLVPISTQAFLIKTSVLDLLHGPLCEAVLGTTEEIGSGQSILESLERADLFLTPVDDRRLWYRCHHLFQQFLRARLEQMHSPTEIAALHLRASTWYAAHGDPDEALRHALAAGDTEKAVGIVARHRHELLNRSEWQRVNRWVRLFPEEVINAHPDLLQIEVWLKFFQRLTSDVPALLDRVEALLVDLPIERAKHLQGEVDARRAAMYFYGGERARAITTAQQALEKLPLEQSYLRGWSRMFMSIAYLTSGDLTRAYATFYETGEEGRSPESQIVLAGMACFMHWLAADLVGMAQAARHVVASAASSDLTEIVTWSRYHLGLYYYQRNDLAAAEELLQPLAMQPHASSIDCFLNSAIILARIRQLQGRTEAAREIAELMVMFGLETQNKTTVFIARAFQAELALRQGHMAEANQWAEIHALSHPSPAFFFFVPPVVLALVLLAENTPASRQQARELLSEMNDLYGSLHFTPIRIRVLALQSMLYSAEGDEQHALAVLEESIALAEPGGFIRLFVDLGAALKPLLRKLSQQGVSPTYIIDILAAFGPDQASPIVGQESTSESVPTPPSSTLLTNRELDVLQLLATRRTDKEIAAALVISPKTVSSHLDHIGNKLGVRGRRAIVEAAKAQGLLT